MTYLYLDLFHRRKFAVQSDCSISSSCSLVYCGLVLLAELVVKLVIVSRSRTKGVLTAKTSENSRNVSGGGGCSSTQSPPAYSTASSGIICPSPVTTSDVRKPDARVFVVIMHVNRNAMASYSYLTVWIANKVKTSHCKVLSYLHTSYYSSATELTGELVLWLSGYRT